MRQCITLLALLLLSSACATRRKLRCGPPDPSALTAFDREEDEEKRYYAIRALGLTRRAATQAGLRELATAESAMLRNAAARTRLEAG